MMHTGLGRTHPLHIEYVHIGAALAVIQDILNEAILSHPRLPLPRKVAITKALNKVIWIQNDLFTKWYVHDGEEFTDGMDFGVIEKEGWLHGKKVLNHEGDGHESEASDDTASPSDAQARGKDKAPAGVCPFTGVSASMAKVKIHDCEPERKPDEVEAKDGAVQNGQ
jgi:hypothetical protein